MKTTLQFLLLFFSCCSFAQITLEHTYNEGAVNRVKLEYSGEKYYFLKGATNELVFNNVDHTLWKTILLPAPQSNPLAGGSRIYDVSEARINSDAKIEILYSYYNNMSNRYESRISQEDGTILLTIPDASSVYLDEIPGLSDKLITENIISNPISKVYSLSDLTLENTYTEGTIKRIKLENSGEKYYVLDKTNQNTKIYNPNHSLWKTITLPKPSNAKYGDIGIISENQINTDDLMEIGYSYFTLEGSTYNYVGKLINENNEELLTIPKAKIVSINSIEGLENKLMATLDHNYIDNQISFSTNVYGIPSLTLENAYQSEVARIKLENSGEKYYTSNRQLTNQAKIYNSNHTLWKTINLPIPSDSDINNFLFTVNHISETKIDPDKLLEVTYIYYPIVILSFQTYDCRVINENGEILITANGIDRLLLNELSDLKNKLMGYTYNPFNNSYSSKVYSLENLKTYDFNEKQKVIIAPNPAKSFLNINSLSSPIKEVTIYNMSGALVKRETAQNSTKINIEKLPIGIYIVNLTDFNNQKSTHKITVLRQ